MSGLDSFAYCDLVGVTTGLLALFFEKMGVIGFDRHVEAERQDVESFGWPRKSSGALSTANTIGKVIHGIFGASVPMAIAA